MLARVPFLPPLAMLGLPILCDCLLRLFVYFEGEVVIKTISWGRP